jgi:hypothetical protein
MDTFPRSKSNRLAANTIVGATFLTMLNTVGHAPTFWSYPALNASFIALTFFFVPETRGVRSNGSSRS